MTRYNYSYPVHLSQEQRHFLEQVIRTGKSGAHQQTAARILLLTDQSQGAPQATDGQIADSLGVCRQTVIRTKKRFYEQGLQRAFVHDYPTERPEQRRLDGAGEAELITLACSPAPEGHDHWTIRLLADRLVRLEVVEAISPETVRRTLKKTN